MANPLVTVIVPCYNGAAILDSCVTSIIDQQISSEIIIVDDGSTDDSIERVRRLMQFHGGRIVLGSQVNQGPAAARNLGIRMARGKYLSFLDVDDQLAPGALGAAINLLESDPAAAAVQGRIELVNPHRQVADWQRESMEATVPGNLVLRREVAIQMGGFSVDPAFRGTVGGEDGALRVQLARYFKVLPLNRPFLKYFVREGSHVDYFLGRSILRDGALQFTEQSPEERDGSLFAAFERYAQEVSSRILTKITGELQTEITAAVDLRRYQQQFGQSSSEVDPLEGFALYCFLKRWPVGGDVVQISLPDPPCTCWLAAGCKVAGSGRVIVIVAGDQTRTDEALRQAGLRDLADFHSGSIEQIAPDRRKPLRLLFVGRSAQATGVKKEIDSLSALVAEHGLFAVHHTSDDAAITALYDAVRNDMTGWKALLNIQKLTIFEKQQPRRSGSSRASSGSG